ncbi:MAG: prolipoprotein diacylglyceryl transferase family protein [Bacteroidota bacterium]
MDWTIPFEPVVFGRTVNVHFWLEYLAFFIAFRYYIKLRKGQGDRISGEHRLSIILGAVIGALIGSRLMGYLENPQPIQSAEMIVAVLNNKTIMGGLFGGLIAVEVTKKMIGEERRSGDLFTYPIILGIIIGRIGCFLSGVKEFTYGSVSEVPWAMDLGDGFLRHPIALYEIVFLIFLFWGLHRLQSVRRLPDGHLFQFFMIAYFGFRFCIEFIKPNAFFVAGLSSIQWLCLLCWLYYQRTIRHYLKYASQKLHLL